MEIERIQEEVRQMRDCTFIASNGVKITMDCSLLRSMPPHEARQRRAKAALVFREMCAKYGVRPAGGEPDGA